MELAGLCPVLTLFWQEQLVLPKPHGLEMGVRCCYQEKEIDSRQVGSVGHFPNLIAHRIFSS